MISYKSNTGINSSAKRNQPQKYIFQFFAEEEFLSPSINFSSIQLLSSIEFRAHPRGRHSMFKEMDEKNPLPGEEKPRVGLLQLIQAYPPPPFEVSRFVFKEPRSHHYSLNENKSRNLSMHETDSVPVRKVIPKGNETASRYTATLQAFGALWSTLAAFNRCVAVNFAFKILIEFDV